MQTISIKQSAVQVITQLPETATMEDIMYQLYVLDQIQHGQKAAEVGQTLTIQEMKSEIALLR